MDDNHDFSQVKSWVFPGLGQEIKKDIGLSGAFPEALIYGEISHSSFSKIMSVLNR